GGDCASRRRRGGSGGGGPPRPGAAGRGPGGDPPARQTSPRRAGPAAGRAVSPSHGHEGTRFGRDILSGAMSGRFAARFAALGAAEGVLVTLVWCAIAAVALPAGARASALTVALTGGLAYCTTVAALRVLLATRLRDPARVTDSAVASSFASALPPATSAATRYGIEAALLVLGSAATVALGCLRWTRRLSPDEPQAGRGLRLQDLLAGAALTLAVASWATTAGVLLGGQAMLHLPAAATRFGRAAAISGPAFILSALAVAAIAGRALGADINRVRAAVAAMASSGHLEQPLAVTTPDEIGALTHALGELRTHLFAELVTYEQALDRAHKAETRKDAFFGQLTRELHVPLDAIVAEARALQAGEHGAMPAEQQNHVRVIESAAYHLLGLLGDVVDLTVLQSGTLKLAPVEL